ncbi:hypothetical protein [Endozoicomonas sp. GU-1]|uniref:hypothetical protein n=1 Tax=Endozoicomonas sp. GU-1 TaxID=3009078 RepID=UPI0022B30ECB|nr:hypothetical protein [Endozoicomonas sp. GU-1]WBA80033.1 hypothetical protein O2T12_16945 [Endozoicomonas sp. GU-1]WBA87607.1 hypothetical protein O3276_06175 [Endozoicomonas sp. GU-1]
MPPILTSCITLTPTSDSAGTDSNHGPEQASGWSRYWNVSKSIAKSIHPGFNPHQGPDQPDTPWIQLNIQPRELALRLVQKTIPANSYLNTINQLAMACMALASLPGCDGASSEGSASTHGSATANTTGSNKPTRRASSPDTSSTPTPPTSTVPPGCRGEPIPVDRAAVLAKVGKEKEPCYPANGTYTQTTNIDAGNPRLSRTSPVSTTVTAIPSTT